MLNIPEAVKALYLNDTTLHSTKNFRVLFPDGELSEEFPNGITCENIVEESVDFTESICSAMNFRFGLAEAPNISFETVGVPNILGVRIACYSEIDVSGVSDDLTGDYDGEYVSLEDSDLGFPFYRIPLGVFTVDSCTRNHGQMTHRRITAYGAGAFNGDMGGLSELEKWKFNSFWLNDTYSLYPDFWYSQLFNQYPFTDVFDVTSLSLGTTGVGFGATALIHNVKYYQEDPFHGAEWRTGTLRLSGAYASGNGGTFLITHNSGDFLRGFHYSGFTQLCEETKSIISTWIEDNGFDFSEAYIDSDYSINSNEKALEYIYYQVMFNAVPGDREGTGLLTMQFNMSQSNFSWTIPRINRPADDGFIVFSGRCPGISEENAQVVGTVSYGFGGTRATFTASDTGYQTSLPIPAGSEQLECEFAKLVPKTSEELPLPLVIAESTLEQTNETTGITWYGFSNAISFKKLLDGLLETLGRFFRANRDGTYKVFALDDTINENVPTNIIRSLWWDEADIEEIGSVDFQFKDAENKTQDGSLSIGDGASTYVMRQNYFLQNMDDATVESISELLSGEFAAHCQDLTWTPTEAETRGLPYVEAGDYITCATQAQDVTEVKFPMLRRTLSGIQSLREDISSVAGEVVDSAGGGLSV